MASDELWIVSFKCIVKGCLECHSFISYSLGYCFLSKMNLRESCLSLVRYFSEIKLAQSSVFDLFRLLNSVKPNPWIEFNWVLFTMPGIKRKTNFLAKHETLNKHQSPFINSYPQQCQSSFVLWYLICKNSACSCLALIITFVSICLQLTWMKEPLFVCNSYSQEILTDWSEGKVTSHEWLLNFIQKYSDPSVLAHVYLKGELESLCAAYEVRFRRSEIKKVFATKLLEGIKSNRTMSFTGSVDDQQFRVVETVADGSLGSVRIRFRLSGKYLMTMTIV